MYDPNTDIHDTDGGSDSEDEGDISLIPSRSAGNRYSSAPPLTPAPVRRPIKEKNGRCAHTPEEDDLDIIPHRKMRKLADAAKLNIYAKQQANQRDFFDSDGDDASVGGRDISIDDESRLPISTRGGRKVRTTKLEPEAEDLGKYSARAQRVLQGGREETKLFTLTDEAWPSDDIRRKAAMKAHTYAVTRYAKEAEECESSISSITPGAKPALQLRPSRKHSRMI